jgi:precorrin-3B C17-methyltransferase
VTLYLVGLGPGSREHLTLRAAEVLQACEAVVGYGPYVDLVAAWFPNQEHRLLVRGELGQEKTRAREAIRLARDEGLQVALVSSGDASIYGMGGPLFRALLDDGWSGEYPRVEVVPGVTAALSANALLGAPLADDLALVSLSDVVAPWSLIAERLEAAARADFVLALYNPASERRRDGIRRAQEILLRHKAPTTPVALVRNALRPEPSVCLTTLADLPHDPIDMFTLVLVGNSQTMPVGQDRLVSCRAAQRAQPPAKPGRRGEPRPDGPGCAGRVGAALAPGPARTTAPFASAAAAARLVASRLAARPTSGGGDA